MVAEEMAVVETWNLSKVYRTGFWLDKTIASLKNCSLRINRGETFGLLGPNGAGKTTLLKTLLGIIRPTSGKGVLLGKPIGDRSVKKRIGYLPENAYLYDYLTGWEFLEFSGDLFEIPRSAQQKRIRELLDLVGLAESAARKKQIRKYSKGMQQRIAMAQALINDPEVVFLDEPMSGLDPLGRDRVRQIVLSLKEQGKTIFFNSHVLADVEQICDRIALLARGDLICTGSLNELLGTNDGYQVIISGGDREALLKWIPNLVRDRNCWRGQLKGQLDEFVAAIREMEAQIIRIDRARLSLEEFFVGQLQEKGILSSQ